MFKKIAKPQNAYDSFLKLQSQRNSSLAWILLGAVGVMWAYNGWTLYQEYREDVRVEIAEAQTESLTAVSNDVENLMRLVYEHIRTISLLPSIRRVGAFNRLSEAEDVVDQGRLSVDTHQTIQQIYRNLNSTVDLSEIYVTLNGFSPDQGEVPFAMYDDAISGAGIDPNVQLFSDHSANDPYEDDEYREYVVQLKWFKEQYPEWLGKNDITKIPALTSALLRTCDNTQFDPSQADNFQNTLGLLYSTPIFSLANQQFVGLVSAVIRANVLEAVISGIPFIPVTNSDFERFGTLGVSKSRTPSNFILTNGSGLKLFDRTNEELASRADDILQELGDDHLASVTLDIVSDSEWTLYRYMTHADMKQLVETRTIRFYRDIAIRMLLLLVFAVMLIKALRDQGANHKNLVRLAHFDTLTDLPNRSMLYSALGQSIKRAERTGTRIGLLFLDVDDFGIINDSTSHTIGDLVLQNIASRLRGKNASSASQTIELGGYQVTPLVSRLGGDDFALIFEDLPSAEIGAVLGQMQIDKFNEPMLINGQVVDVSL